MADILIRGLSDDAVKRIDARAASLGLSRNELLRRDLEGPEPRTDIAFGAADIRRAGDAVRDLLDDDLMERAWR